MNLILDANYVCHKVRHGMKGIELTSESFDVEVIFGFLKTFLMICKRFRNVDNHIFCWDSQKSERKKIFPDYKKKRIQAKKEQTPEEKDFDRRSMNQFWDIREELLPMMGLINNFIQTRRESDDIIASIVLNNPNDEFLIITSDQDIYQLLRHNVRIYSLHTRDFMHTERFIEKFGIDPNQWAKAKAIGGCDTDEVPGVKGVADPAKSVKSKALSYLRGELTKGKVFDRIESPEGQEIIYRNLKLVQLPYKGTFNFPIERKSLWRADFRKAFEEFKFESMLKKDTFREWEIVMGLN